MYSFFKIAGKYLNYYVSASNGKGHGMHSPFVFNFITRILNDEGHYPEYDKVEELRHALLKDHQPLQIDDMGAGSTSSNAAHRTVASLAKRAAKPRKFGQLLYRMVKTFQPRTVVELGTSLGISTAYLSLGNPTAKVITIEGSKEIASKARKNFQRLGLGNVSSVIGNFDDTLGHLIEPLSTVDLCFIDGNHRLEPTLRYFHQLLPKMNNESILIFDDIHWSEEMEAAWEKVREHPKVRCTIDLFFIGIVFFREEFREKREFVVRF
ncbi:MAG: class I SAM-dependent methyltransferase [Chitinophagaceae bacterium]|nr:class I SAM-dependent methyltransferase [Chitinophagaceae bacterium]